MGLAQDAEFLKGIIYHEIVSRNGQIQSAARRE